MLSTAMQRGTKQKMSLPEGICEKDDTDKGFGAAGRKVEGAIYWFSASVFPSVYVTSLQSSALVPAR